MSQQVANIDLSNATVGQTGTLVLLEKLLPPPTLAQQMRPMNTDNAAHLVILNESGCQLLLTLPSSNQTKTLAAGRWVDLILPPHESEVNYTVQAVATGVFHSLLADFYWPGEPVEELGVLGNSPIGGQSTLGTQVIQDGQPNGQVIVEATPTGQPQNVLIKTDGTTVLAGMTAFYGSLFGGFSATLFEPASNHQSGAGVNGQVFAIWNGSAIANILAIGATDGRNAPTMIGPSGQFTQVAGQAAAGGFGVPVIIASGTAHVTSTLTQTLFSVTIAATGLYRFSAGFVLSNGTSPQPITIFCYSMNPAIFTSATSFVVLNGTNDSVTNGTWITIPLVVPMGQGQVVTATYHDPGGTPADDVWMVLERLM